MVNKTFVSLFFLLTTSMSWADESEVINDWLINFDDTVCWATASITEDPSNDEYDQSEDFQFTV